MQSSRPRAASGTSAPATAQTTVLGHARDREASLRVEKIARLCYHVSLPQDQIRCWRIEKRSVGPLAFRRARRRSVGFHRNRRTLCGATLSQLSEYMDLQSAFMEWLYVATSNCQGYCSAEHRGIVNLQGVQHRSTGRRGDASETILRAQLWSPTILLCASENSSGRRCFGVALLSTLSKYTY